MAFKLAPKVLPRSYCSPCLTYPRSFTPWIGKGPSTIDPKNSLCNPPLPLSVSVVSLPHFTCTATCTLQARLHLLLLWRQQSWPWPSKPDLESGSRVRRAYVSAMTGVWRWRWRRDSDSFRRRRDRTAYEKVISLNLKWHCLENNVMNVVRTHGTFFWWWLTAKCLRWSDLWYNPSCFLKDKVRCFSNKL